MRARVLLLAEIAGVVSVSVGVAAAAGWPYGIIAAGAAAIAAVEVHG